MEFKIDGYYQTSFSWYLGLVWSHHIKVQIGMVATLPTIPLLVPLGAATDCDLVTTFDLLMMASIAR